MVSTLRATRAPLSTTRPPYRSSILFLLGISVRLPHFGLLPVALVPAIWLLLRRDEPATGRTRKSLRVLWLAISAALLFGLGLRFALPSPSSTLTGTVGAAAWIVGIGVFATAGAKAVRVVGYRRALPLIGLSAILGGYLSEAQYHSTNEYWKFVVGHGVVILLLSLLPTGRKVTLFFSACLVVFSVVQGARSLALQLAIATILVALSGRERQAHAHFHLVRLAVSGAVAAGILVTGMQAGWFGSGLQQLYDLQTRGHLNLIVGGRAELAAAGSLFSDQPFGFGLGARPNDVQESAAISAVSGAGGDTFGPYYPQYVFGPRVDLHSSTVNLWFHSGLGGLAVAGFLASCLVRGGAGLAMRRPGLAIALQFAIWSAGWDLLFSPMSNLDSLTGGVMLGLAGLEFAKGTSDDA